MSEKITAEQFFSAIKSTGKLTGADILNNLINSNGNLHMKADISSPEAYTAMHVKANWLDQVKLPIVAERYRDIANFAEQFSCGKDGKRAGMVAESLVSVMLQEFEMEKSRAKMMLGK